jgi:hypothetical protein
MTTSETKGAEQVSISTKTPGGFDLHGQFTAATAVAVMAAAVEVRPQPRAPTKVLGAFDPRFGHPVAVHRLFPDAGREDFSDDRSNSDETETDSSSLGVAHDLIGCVIAGEDGTSQCNHSGVDHVATAQRCLENYSREEAARKQRLHDVSQPHVGVRFA